MPVKLRVEVSDESARTYTLHIDQHGGPDVAVVGPAEARDFIEWSRALCEAMEHQLDLAGLIDEALLAKFAVPHPAGEIVPTGGNAPAVESSAHCQGEGQPSLVEGT